MEPVFEKISLVDNQLYRLWVRHEVSFPFQWHFHPEYELTLITQGQGTLLVGDNVSQYRAGDLVFLGANLPHTFHSHQAERADSDGLHEAICLQFQPELINPAWMSDPHMDLVRGLFENSSRGLAIGRETRARIARIMHECLNLWGFSRLIGLMQIFEVLAADKAPRPIASVRYAQRKHDTQRRANAIYQYLHEHYLEEIRLPQIARHFKMTPNSFHRYFKRATCTTFSALVHEFRIGHACNLLLNSELSVSEICYASGFNNLSHFYRKFGELKGLTPRTYRAHFRQ